MAGPGEAPIHFRSESKQERNLAVDRVGTDIPLDRALVEKLARESGRPVAEVEQVMREELLRLNAQARIDTYVTVLATRSTRARLHRVKSVRH